MAPKKQIYESACMFSEQGALKKLTAVITKHKIIDCSPPCNYSPFHFAVNHREVIAYLTNSKLKVYKKFNDGTVEIHAAAFAGRINEVVSIIKKDKTQLTLLNSRSENAFYWAAVGKQYTLIEVLLNLDNRDDHIYDIIAGASYLATFHLSKKKYSEAKAAYKAMIFYQSKLKNFTNSDSADITDYEKEIKICDAKIASVANVIIEVRQPDEKQNNTGSIFTRLNELNNSEWFAQNDSVNKVAKQWGFSPYDVTPNGDCLFAAISHQIGLNRDLFPARHQLHTDYTLRQLAVNHLKANKDVYHDFFGETAPPDSKISIDDYIQIYLNDMANSGSWGDHLTIVALVAELKISLVIISNNKNDPIIVKAHDSIAKLYIIHANLTHYQSTLVQDAQKIRDGIEVMIERAPIEEIAQFAALTSETTTFLVTNPKDDKFYDANEQKPDNKLNNHVKLIQPVKQSAAAIFKLMSTIADPATTSEEAEALIMDNKISHIDAAVLRRDWDTIENILTSQPTLIDEEHDAITIFYWAALVGNDGLILLLSWLNCFSNLDCGRQAYCYDDALKGAMDRAENLAEFDQLEDCVLAYEHALHYGENSTSINWSDDDIDMMQELRERLYSSLDNLLDTLLENHKLTEAIAVKEKLIACYAAYEDPIPEYLTRLQSQLVDLQTQEKSQGDLHQTPQVQQNVNAMATTNPLVKTLFTHTALIVQTSDTFTESKRNTY